MGSHEPKVLCAIGIDGSGKSTFLSILHSELEKRGHRPPIAWMRWKPTISLPLMGLLRATGVTRPVETPQGSYLEKRFAAYPLAGKAWRTLLPYDVWIQRVRFSRRWKGIPLLLADRYAYDIVVDAAADLGDSSWVKSPCARRIIGMFPHPEEVIYVRVDPKVAFSRKKDVPSLEYLRLRAESYDVLARHLPLTILENPTLEELKMAATQISTRWNQ